MNVRSRGAWRRRLLRQIGLLPLLFVGLGSRAAEPKPASGDAFRTLIDGAYWRVGQAYAEKFPQDARRPFGDAELARTPVAWSEQVSRDFRSGDVVVLNGWVLSRSECRLCALAYLRGRPLYDS